MIKKVDILNFITDFRKAPNTVKKYSELVAHLGAENEPTIKAMLAEMSQIRAIKESEVNGEKAYQAMSK